jgi:hypothetical protein
LVASVLFGGKFFTECKPTLSVGVEPADGTPIGKCFGIKVSAKDDYALALHAILEGLRALNDAPDGRPMRRRMIERLDGATADAVEFAAARRWVQV